MNSFSSFTITNFDVKYSLDQGLVKFENGNYLLGDNVIYAFRSDGTFTGTNVKDYKITNSNSFVHFMLEMHKRFIHHYLPRDIYTL